MPSTAWLMPSDQFWNDSEILVYSPHYNYTVKDYKKLFEDINHPTGYLMHEDTAHLVRVRFSVMKISIIYLFIYFNLSDSTQT